MIKSLLHFPQYDRLSRQLAMTSCLLVIAILGVSCQKSSAHQVGMIVVTVEGLKSDDLPCNDPHPSTRSGFNLLCHEFLHVKGMVASSTSSVANVAALLSAEKPVDLNILTNNDTLDAKYESVAEKVHRLGWRTSAFISSPPVSRRSGLTQGFEFVDESSHPRRAFRVVEEVLSSLRNWLSDDSRPFFALVSLSDLLHPEVPTHSDSGENRNLSVDSQLEELDESLFHFFEDLKKSQRWDSSWIVFVGLQGRPDKRESLPRTLQMSPNHLVVPAFIKPPGKIAAKKPLDTMEGTWTHAELGRLIEDILIKPEFRTMNVESVARRLESLEPNFVASRGCLSQAGKKSVCRVAFFDQNNWLAWDKAISTEIPGRKELFRKISELPAEYLPQRFSRHVLQSPREDLNSTTYDHCVQDFFKGDMSGSFSSLCPSRPIQLLREMAFSKSGDNRDLRLQFIRRWSDIAYAHRIYQWSRNHQIDILPNPDPYAEFLALDKLLSRPEYSELKREAERSL